MRSEIWSFVHCLCFLYIVSKYLRWVLIKVYSDKNKHNVNEQRYWSINSKYSQRNGIYFMYSPRIYTEVIHFTIKNVYVIYGVLKTNLFVINIHFNCKLNVVMVNMWWWEMDVMMCSRYLINYKSSYVSRSTISKFVAVLERYSYCIESV